MMDSRVECNAPDPARRNSAREDRYGAREVLREYSILPRVRGCGMPRLGEVTVKHTAGAAGFDGLETCGNTWACPVCSERIQSERQREVAAALAAARQLGLTVGFLTLTVRHHAHNSLSNVWEAVSDAWRKTTSGSRGWVKDQYDYGIAGYLRLTEVTHGDANGWHVHLHVLVFLDPQGAEVVHREKYIGPLLTGDRAARAAADALVSPYVQGPLFPEQRRATVKQWIARGHYLGAGIAGPLTKEQHDRHAVRRPLVEVGRSRAACPVAIANFEADRAVGRVDARHGIYLRDLRALAARMFGRWQAALDGTGFKPDERHGYDVRLVTDENGIADYFAKAAYAVKSTGSTAHDVTGSHAKTSKRGNVTPFGILARFVATGDTADLALWHEWEGVSKGRRQLLWSNGMRELLGLDAERSDEEVAGDALDGDGVIAVSRETYRRIVRAGRAARLLALVERDPTGVSAGLWLTAHGYPWQIPGRPSVSAALRCWRSRNESEPFSLQRPPLRNCYHSVRSSCYESGRNALESLHDEHHEDH